MNLKKHIHYPEQEIMSKTVVKEEDVNITLFCMAKGTDMSEHTSSKEASIYVIEGKGVFNLEGEDIIMEEGVFIRMEKNASHSLKAEENTAFILTLFK
jgi:quercetin dioxygenase-like cupin family protein